MFNFAEIIKQFYKVTLFSPCIEAWNLSLLVSWWYILWQLCSQVYMTVYRWHITVWVEKDDRKQTYIKGRKPLSLHSWANSGVILFYLSSHVEQNNVNTRLMNVFSEDKETNKMSSLYSICKLICGRMIQSECRVKSK